MNQPLAATTMGKPGAPRLVLLHGFTQNSQCWSNMADLLAEHFELVLVDLPGHGDSQHDEADLDQAAALVAEVGGRAHYLGYSMGGRILVHLALARPDLVHSMTLIGATGGIDDADERSARREADRRLADRIVSDGLAAFLDFWLALDLFADVPAAASCREQRLQNRAGGVAASLLACGTGTQRPLWDDLAKLEVPSLVLAGDQDTKFGELGQRLVDAIGGNAELERPPGGHAVHLVSPDQVTASVVRFVSATRSV